MKNAGRAVAVLLLLQMICGPIVNFALLKPVMSAPGFLVNAVAHPMHLSLAIVLGLAMGAMNLGIAIAAWPAIRVHGERLALALFAAAVAAFVLMAVEYTGVMSMASLSRAHVAAGADGARFEALAGVVSAARANAHFLGLMASCVVALLLYVACFRHALVPRVIGGIGVVGASLALLAAGMPLFGKPVMLPLMSALGVAHLVMVVWSLVKGFRSEVRGD